MVTLLFGFAKDRSLLCHLRCSGMINNERSSTMPDPSPDLPPLLLCDRQAERFIALQRCLVPRSQHFSADQVHTSLQLVNRLLQQQTDSSRKKLGLFLRIIDILSILMGGRSFRNLSAVAQNRVMQRLFDSPIGLLRKGFWGLNTLARYGVYGQPDLYQEIGYVLRSNPDE